MEASSPVAAEAAIAGVNAKTTERRLIQGERLIAVAAATISPSADAEIPAAFASSVSMCISVKEFAPTRISVRAPFTTDKL